MAQARWTNILRYAHCDPLDAGAPWDGVALLWYRDEAARHVAAIESDAGGFTPLGFTCSLRDAAAEAVRRRLLPLQDFGAGAFLPGAGSGGADLGPLLALGVPCYGLLVDGQKYFDYHHTAVDDLQAVHERELALGAAAVAFAAWTLADG
jgi:hypothetical protein